MEDRNEVLAAAALKIDEAARNQKIPVRLLGGMAVYLNCECTRNDPFSREINDLDFVVTKRKASDFGKLLHSLGFEGDKQFNSIHGETRMLFYSKLTEVDVFVGMFLQCHELDLEKHMEERRITIPLAYLLLTKLQIVKSNRKDLLDTIALLHDHELTPNGGEDCIDMNSITGVTGNDWGWHTTVTDNLEKAYVLVHELFEGQELQMLTSKINKLKDAMEQADKSIKWKIRAKIGRKLTWYELPEEKKL